MAGAAGLLEHPEDGAAREAEHRRDLIHADAFLLRKPEDAGIAAGADDAWSAPGVVVTAAHEGTAEARRIEIAAAIPVVGMLGQRIDARRELQRLVHQFHLEDDSSAAGFLGNAGGDASSQSRTNVLNKATRRRRSRANSSAAVTPASPREPYDRRYVSNAPKLPLNRPALILTTVLAFGQDAVYALIFLSYMNHYLLDELHASAGLPGYTLALYGGTKLVVHPLAGRLLDRTTPRFVYRASIAVQVAGLGLLLATHTLWAFLVAALLLAAASAAMWPLIYDTVARTQTEGVRTRVTGILSMSGYIATGFGFAAGVLLANFAPWRAAFVLALVIVGAPLAVQGMRALDSGTQIEERARDEIASLGAFRTLASVALFGTVVLIDYAAITSLAAVYGPYARVTLGLSLLRTTVMLAPAAVAALAMLFLAARLSRPRRRLLEMSGLYGLAAGGALALALTTNPWAAAVFAPVLAAGAGGIGPIIAATMIDQGSEGDRGLVIGALMSVEGIGSVIGPAATALAIDVVSPRAGLALIGGLFALLVPITAGAYWRQG